MHSILNALQIYEKFVVHWQMIDDMLENNVKNTVFLSGLDFFSQFSNSFEIVIEDEKSL